MKVDEYLILHYKIKFLIQYIECMKKKYSCNDELVEDLNELCARSMEITDAVIRTIKED